MKAKTVSLFPHFPLSDKQWAYIALASICLIWGTTFLGIKIAVHYIPAMLLSGLRFSIAGTAVCAYFLLRGARLPSGRTFLFLCANGLLMIGTSNFLTCWAEQFISSGLAAILSALVPFWIALMGTVLMNTYLSWRLVAGLLVGFLGIVGIFANNLADLANPDYRLGILAVVGSTVVWSLGTIFTTKYRASVHLFLGAGIQMAFSGYVLMGMHFATGDPNVLLTIHPNGWWAVLYLAIFGSIIAFIAYTYTITQLPPTQAALYAYINPIVAIVLGWLILDETLNLAIFLSALVTVYGIFLVNREAKKQLRAVKT